ncbi:MAG: PDZ domain-containing protein [Phycisphaerales bacterium]|nr:MAG: PDZ domain-containing protein [Phycisphaerales bacterium]
MHFERSESMNFRRGVSVWSAAALLAGAGVLWAGPAWAGEREVSPEAERAIEHAESLSAAFRHAAAVIRPSVVQIRSSRTVQVRQRSPFPFEGFPFGDPFGQTPQREQRQSGMGSGVVTHADGYIVTNNHVIDGADELVVVFEDGTEAAATVVGADPQTDIAVIRVDPERASYALVPARIGDSDRMLVGDWVLAVGSPLGLEQSVTAGIISATGRQTRILGQSGLESFIQTDAAINRGNSGGPMVNMRGEVIGINTAIMTTGAGGGNVGIGFAIPTSLFGHVVAQLIDEGRVTRGFIGVRISDLTPDAASLLGLSDRTLRGALVVDVEPGSPAESAGVLQNDVIVAVGGEKVRDVGELRLALARIRPGEQALLEVVREGERVGLEVVVGDPESEHPALRRVGLALSDIDAETARRLNLRQNWGAQVTHVRAGGAADQAGIAQGDIILGINNLRVRDAASLASFLERARPGMALQIDVMRGDRGMERKVLRVPDTDGR